MSFSDNTLSEFLAAVASREPAPGGGAVAALTAAAAAGLAAMAARFTTGELAELAEPADELRARITPLADADAAAYTQVLAAYQLPRTDPDRRTRITEALRGAADVPLRIAEASAEVATLAARLAAGGNPNLVGDARAAALLAEAATRTAVGLVEINVKLGGLDGTWLDDTARHTRTAADAVKEASS